MSSLTRALAVLDLFTSEQPVWTAEAAAEAIGCSVPTIYRYFRDFSSVGLLQGGANATFMLGPKVIELDYQIRTGDPLISAGRGSMRQLADTTGCSVVLVTIYGGHIVTVHQEFGVENISASYGRGRRMPVFKGAMSKCLLSALSKPQLRKLYAQQTTQGEADVPAWDDVLAQCQDLRRKGYAISHGELDKANTGIAVPLIVPAYKIVASLGFIISSQRMELIEPQRAVSLLKKCVAEIVEQLSKSLD